MDLKLHRCRNRLIIKYKKVKNIIINDNKEKINYLSAPFALNKKNVLNFSSIIRFLDFKNKI